MTKINRKIQERLRAGLRCFKPLLKAAKERDASRADTATLALDLLSDLFGFDRYSEVTSEQIRHAQSGRPGASSKLGRQSVALDFAAAGIELLI